MIFNTIHYIYIHNEIPKITGYHHFVCIHHYAPIVAKTLSIFSVKILLNLVFVDQFGWGPGVLPFLETFYDLENILGPKNANQNKSNNINMEKLSHTLRSCGPSKSSAIVGWFPQSSPSFLVFSQWGGQNLMLPPLHLHYVHWLLGWHPNSMSNKFSIHWWNEIIISHRPCIWQYVEEMRHHPGWLKT